MTTVYCLCCLSFFCMIVFDSYVLLVYLTSLLGCFTNFSTLANSKWSSWLLLCRLQTCMLPKSFHLRQLQYHLLNYLSQKWEIIFTLSSLNSHIWSATKFCLFCLQNKSRIWILLTNSSILIPSSKSLSSSASTISITYYLAHTSILALFLSVQQGWNQIISHSPQPC